MNPVKCMHIRYLNFNCPSSAFRTSHICGACRRVARYRIAFSSRRFPCLACINKVPPPPTFHTLSKSINQCQRLLLDCLIGTRTLRLPRTVARAISVASRVARGMLSLRPITPTLLFSEVQMGVGVFFALFRLTTLRN